MANAFNTLLTAAVDKWLSDLNAGPMVMGLNLFNVEIHFHRPWLPDQPIPGIFWEARPGGVLFDDITHRTPIGVKYVLVRSVLPLLNDIFF